MNISRTMPPGKVARGRISGANGPAKVFELIPLIDLEAREPNWLVEGFIETQTLGQVFGDPGAGKSFFALDLAFSVATGRPFHGRPVRQGTVIYIAGEGHSGLARRRAAWVSHTGQALPRESIVVSKVAAQFLDPESAEAVEREVDRIAEQTEEVTLIVVDTLARNFGPGQESDTGDMSKFVAIMDALKARYDAAVLIVHHSGHQEKHRGRGSMSLLGALDHEFRLQKFEDGEIKLTATKMKDFENPEPLHFKLKPVELGTAKSGKPYGSAVLVRAPAKAAGGGKLRKLTGNQRLGLNSLEEARKIRHPDDPSAAVHVDDWRKQYYKRSTADGQDAKKKSFQRVRKELTSQGIISVEDEMYKSNDLS